MSRALRVGARGSRLSLWQVHHAIETLHRRGVAADLVVLSSSGDRDRHAAIEDLPSAAPFADDLEDALDAGAIDVAVHSLQLDPANARQAVEEARCDAEGADMLMVKPALPYLDVIAPRVRATEPGLPLVAYQVSGEYSMLKAAAANGWIDEAPAVDETLTAIKRAGADVIITYFAVDAARRLAHVHS